MADLFTRLWDDRQICRQAGPDHVRQGVDIYAQPRYLDGAYAAIRCMVSKRGMLTRAIVAREIDRAEAFMPPLAEYLIVTTGRRDALLADALREINGQGEAADRFPVYVVFWEDLCRLLDHPDNRDIRLKHYGAALSRSEPVLPRPRQIPEPPRPFIDREEALEKLTAALREGGITVCGVGGVGKTALALKLAQRLSDDYAHAQIFIDLRGTSPSPQAPADVMAWLIHTFRPRAELPAAESGRSDLYHSILQGRRALLVLDDAAGADQVRPLLPPAPCASATVEHLTPP